MNNEIVKINNSDLVVKEYNGQRVVTFKDIDMLHERPEGTAGRNFRKNKYESNGKTERFIKGIDYFDINPKEFQPDEIRRFGIESPRGGIVLTQTGYSMLVKSFEDDLSWKVQRQLVNGYFKLQEVKQEIEVIQNKQDDLSLDKKKEKIQIEGELLKIAIDAIHPSEASKIKMVRNFIKMLGGSSNYLPTYVDEESARSATDLLKKFNSNLSTRKFNELMIQQGFMEQQTRKSKSHCIRQFKVLTSKGLKYGKNAVFARGNETESHPLYFEDSFIELLNMVGGVALC